MTTQTDTLVDPDPAASQLQGGTSAEIKTECPF